MADTSLAQLLERLAPADIARWRRTADDAAAVMELVRVDNPAASEAAGADALLAIWGGCIPPGAELRLGDRVLDYGDICRALNWLNRTPMRAVFSATFYRC